MTYTAAETEPLAERLITDLHGMHIEVARAWITVESGIDNNPLGVTIIDANGNRVLASYPTQLAGIDAAAVRVKTNPVYSGIMGSLDGTIKDQALAIIASPWNVRNSPYYRREFTAMGLLVDPPPVNPKVRVIGPFYTYTVRGNTVIGDTLRTVSPNAIYTCSEREYPKVADTKTLMLRQLTSGPFKGEWIVAHGPLAFSN